MSESAEQTVKERVPPAPETAAQKRRGWLFLLGMAGSGAVVGYVGASWLGDLFVKPSGAVEVIMMVLLLPLIWLLVVGWHELGHLVGGWLTGGRFLLWVVGPIMLRRTPAGLQWARNRSVNVGGGVAVCVPTDPASVTPGRTAVMVLGGPVASIVLVGLAWAAMQAWGPALGAVALNGLAFTAALSGLGFVLTLAPFIAGGFKSDGKRAWDLLKGDARSDQEAALLLLTTAGLGGMRPADYDPALIKRASALADGSMFDLYGQLTIYYYHADRGNWAEAQACLDRVVDGEGLVVPYLRDVVRCEYAWLLATRTIYAGTARAWLETVGKLDFDPATKLRAEAAVALATGERDLAQDKIEAAKHALEHRSLSPVRNPFAEAALDRLAAALVVAK